jgi:hypothetical protein
MRSRLRRIVFAVAVALMVVLVGERQLDDGMRVLAGYDPVPPLWEEAAHPARPILSIDAHEAARRSNVNCPLVTSLDLQNPFPFTPVDKGVRFDIDADGDLEQVSWTEPGTDVAFLAIDADNDGAITSGRELIGRYAVAGVTGSADALGALARNAAGGRVHAALDSEHPLFPRVLFWIDFNHNGVSEPSELDPVSGSVADIGLGFRPHHRRDRFGNESRFRGFVHVRTAPGANAATSAVDDMARLRPVYDVCLAGQ